jgi:hypothetical protein
MSRPRQYDPEAIREHAREHPHLTRAEAARHFGCSQGTYQRNLGGMGTARKLSLVKERPPRRPGAVRGSPRENDALILRLVRECGGNMAAARRRLYDEHQVDLGYLTIRRIVRGTQSADPDRRTKSRFALVPAVNKTARMLSGDNPALTEKRTVYGQSLYDPGEGGNLLKLGEHSAKIGGVVLKGRWTGFPIYTLTLEERATCPTSCRHWRSCFGNAMPWARRARHGPALEDRLPYEVGMLQGAHPRGFVVRLHVLGDFYSVGYVDLWRRMLDTFPALRVFGYTARIDYQGDPIARALIDLALGRWDRFAMRFSNAPVDECSTVSIEHPIQRPADAVVCPQQVGGTESCSSCAFCWESKKRVAFVQH